MKSLICSDIHDQIQNLEVALKVASTSNCESILCCGDLCAPFIIDIFHENCTIPVHLIFGNNDGDRFNISNRCNEYNTSRSPETAITVHGTFLIKKSGVALAGLPEIPAIAMYHYPEPALAAFRSQEFNYVFFGHTHKPHLESNDSKLLANPGSLMGYVPGKNRGFVKPTCLLIDWNTSQADLIEL